MAFLQRMTELEQAISKEISRIYHLSEEDALAALRGSDFYQLLADESTGLWKDGPGVNFGRYQNEVEYGAWDK